MKMFYALGDALVTREELVEKAALGYAKAFNKVAAGKPTEASLTLSNGLLTCNNAIKAIDGVTPDNMAAGFEPIGIGKPLTIEIREIYSGKYPRGWFDSSKDMLVTTAMKGIEVFSGAPRAINFLAKEVARNSRVRYNDPTQPGTPLVYYCPALTRISSVLRVDVAFKEFPNEIFEVLSKAAATASGIPVFAPASAYLFVASQVLNLVSKIGSAAFDASPDFGANTPVTFDRPGDYPLVADFRLLMDEEPTSELLDHYKINDQGTLVRMDNGKPYNGDYPYIVLTFDGRERDHYKDFVPTAATADMLQRFLGCQDVFSTSIDAAVEAMRLYSDWKFREQASLLNKKYAAQTDAKRKDELRKLRDAANDNIQKDELKLKFPE